MNDNALYSCAALGPVMWAANQFSGQRISLELFVEWGVRLEVV